MSTPRSRAILEAFSVASIFSGGPSTLHALVTGGDPMAATKAAGAMFVAADAEPWLLYGSAALVHLSVSALWTIVLARTLPNERTYLAATGAALGIAALDLGIIGRFFPSIVALQVGPQVADHLAFTLLVAWVLKRRGALAPTRGVG